MGRIQRLFAEAERLRRRPPAARVVRPQVEPLEDRTVPATFDNQAFVATLYRTLLNRTVEPGGLAFWTGALDAGATRLQVASGILNSPEYRAREVENIYEVVLGRQADLFGLTFWTGALRGGATLKQVEAGIFASDEFFTRAGGNSAAFLNLLSQDVLGRPADPTVTSLLPLGFASPTARATAAFQVLNSDAVNITLVTNFYQEILGRAPEPGGLSFWTGILRAGVTEEAVIAGLFASDEFFRRLQRTTIGQTDPLAAASQFTGTPTVFTITSGLTPSVRLLSPAFGNLPIAFGFSTVGPGVVFGTFGVNGFVPGFGTAPPVALPVSTVVVTSAGVVTVNGGLAISTPVPTTTFATSTSSFVNTPGLMGSTFFPNVTPAFTNVTPAFTNVMPAFRNTTVLPGFAGLTPGFGTGPQLVTTTTGPRITF
jgi:hypothetical protein